MSWGFGHFFTSLSEWTSFNHDQCNAILQARNITINNAYLPFKEGWERQQTVPDLLFVCVWLVLVSLGAWRAWRPENRLKMKAQRVAFPLLFLYGIFFVRMILIGAVQYVDTCRSLLSK